MKFAVSQLYWYLTYDISPQLAHAVSIRKDTRYGCSGSQSLSPAEKEDNADNYRVGRFC